VRYQFVDCRWELGKPERGRELYFEAHIPGASFLDVDTDLSDLSKEGQGRHPLPSADRFAATASRAGVGEGIFVIAYGSFGGAERLWWLLRHFGHDDCAVLLDGIESWGGELRRGEEQVEPAALTARERAGDTIEVEEFLARRDELVVVDARIASRWRGEPNAIDKVPGRIPGALNAPWDEQLPDLPEGELVAYCGSGVTACHNLLAMEHAGLHGARLYAGSWSEWSSDPSRPIETGTKNS
jgi:thiosulfate/3-mercaptopyruvate sulfurtransferase